MMASWQKPRRRVPFALDRASPDAVAPVTGFALIELLVVVALLILLTTLYWGFTSGNQPRQQQKACQANLAKIYVALSIYSNEHEGKFPEVAGAPTAEEPLNALLPRYTVDTAAFICPASQDPLLRSGEPLSKGRISYAYYMGRRAADTPAALMSDRQVDTLAKAAGQSVFSVTGQPPGNNHRKEGGNFLFTDGRLEWTAASATFPLPLASGVVLLNPKP